jgi:hypothetical protein
VFLGLHPKEAASRQPQAVGCHHRLDQTCIPAPGTHRSAFIAHRSPRELDHLVMPCLAAGIESGDWP